MYCFSPPVRRGCLRHNLQNVVKDSRQLYTLLGSAADRLQGARERHDALLYTMSDARVASCGAGWLRGSNGNSMKRLRGGAFVTEPSDSFLAEPCMYMKNKISGLR